MRKIKSAETFPFITTPRITIYLYYLLCILTLPFSSLCFFLSTHLLPQFNWRSKANFLTVTFIVLLAGVGGRVSIMFIKNHMNLPAATLRLYMGCKKVYMERVMTGKREDLCSSVPMLCIGHAGCIQVRAFSQPLFKAINRRVASRSW